MGENCHPLQKKTILNFGFVGLKLHQLNVCSASLAGESQKVGSHLVFGQDRSRNFFRLKTMRYSLNFNNETARKLSTSRVEWREAMFLRLFPISILGMVGLIGNRHRRLVLLVF